VFRIVPSLVHHSKFIAPKDAPVGAVELKKQALKEYNYYYTGKNIDILDFQVKFNATFYTATVADSGVSNEDVKQKDSQNTAATPTSPVISNGKITNFRKKANGEVYDATDEYKQGKHGNVSIGEAATKLLISADKTKTKDNGGGIQPQDPGNIVVKQFQNAINAPGDMVMVNMKILGDPFYLGDSGFGNYTAQGTTNSNINKDGAINYDRGQVYINVNFKNPTDINGNMYEFPQGAAASLISGLYKVNTLESDFSRGAFTQILELTRMPNFDSSAAAGTGATSGENFVDVAPASSTPSVLEKAPESDEPVETQDVL
jgi:hypothetical protein